MQAISAGSVSQVQKHATRTGDVVYASISGVHILFSSVLNETIAVKSSGIKTPRMLTNYHVISGSAQAMVKTATDFIKV